MPVAAVGRWTLSCSDGVYRETTIAVVTTVTVQTRTITPTRTYFSHPYRAGQPVDSRVHVSAGMAVIIMQTRTEVPTTTTAKEEQSTRPVPTVERNEAARLLCKRYLPIASC